jgi:hypothetical protein
MQPESGEKRTTLAVPSECSVQVQLPLMIAVQKNTS